MRICILLLFIFTSTIYSSRSDASDSKLQLSSKLASLLHVRDMFSGYIKQCTNPKGTYLDPTFVYSTEPDAFGGITPKSAYWPEVVRIYGNFQKSVCQYISAEQFENFYVKQLNEKISEADLRAAIGFYSSQAGVRFQQSIVQVNDVFQIYANDQMSEAYRNAYAQASSELKPLISKFRKSPK